MATALGGGQPASGSQPRDTSGLSGWAGIEAHVAKFDEGQMKGYSEDIDMLLVFAGLFSAILTAFVAETYQTLQPSSADLTNEILTANNQMLIQNNEVLVQGFSALLTGASFTPPPAPIPYISPPFEPSTTSRWINALFFISLVLSLAAALFGILVKQWIREYMHWNSPLALPRENVMVRQFRFEAWDAWNVSAIVSTVPALLEIAMILFLCGMTVLLWTLDDIVAICVSTIVAMFALVVAAVTVLPVFFRRCPYKSPMTWALVATREIIQDRAMWRYLFRRYRSRWHRFIDVRSRTNRLYYPARIVLDFLAFVPIVLFGIYDYALHSERQHGRDWVLLPPKWRDIDLASCRSIPLQLGPWRMPSTFREAVLEEARAYRDMDRQGPISKASDRIEQDTNALLVQIRETILLLRALDWVSEASQNSHIATYLTQCSEVEHHLHWRGLKILLSTIYTLHHYDDSKFSVQSADHWKSFLLRFSLGSIRHPATSGALLNAYIYGLQHFRITWSPTAGCLVFNYGYTRDSDHELLLLNYFPSELKDANEDQLKMFIASVTLWLGKRNLSEVPQGIAVNILEKMVSVAIALSKSATHHDTASVYTLSSHYTPGNRSATIDTTSSDPALSYIPGSNVATVYAASMAAATIHTPSSLAASNQFPRIYSPRVYSPSPLGSNTSSSHAPRILPPIPNPPIPNPPIIFLSDDDQQMKAYQDHLLWIRALSGEQETLARVYGTLFRRLLHALETAFIRGTLFGKQDAIRKHLHEQLQASHTSVTCDVNNCPWVGHNAPEQPAGPDDIEQIAKLTEHYRSCCLLREEVDHAFPARLRWHNAIRTVLFVIKMRSRSRWRWIRRHRHFGVMLAVVFIARLRHRARSRHHPGRSHLALPSLSAARNRPLSKGKRKVTLQAPRAQNPPTAYTTRPAQPAAITPQEFELPLFNNYRTAQPAAGPSSARATAANTTMNARTTSSTNAQMRSTAHRSRPTRAS